MFKQVITCADAEAQATKWAEVQSQLGIMFSATLERIKASAAEAEAEFCKMVQEVKAEAMAVFDKEGFCRQLKDAEDEAKVADVYEVGPMKFGLACLKSRSNWSRMC